MVRSEWEYPVEAIPPDHQPKPQAGPGIAKLRNCDIPVLKCCRGNAKRSV